MRRSRKNGFGRRVFTRSMTVAMESLLTSTPRTSYGHATEAATVDRLTVSVASVDGERSALFMLSTSTVEELVEAFCDSRYPVERLDPCDVTLLHRGRALDHRFRTDTLEDLGITHGARMAHFGSVAIRKRCGVSEHSRGSADR
ncbi:hypothetical protein CYMTET_43075 [Cymbomonas tetramitiformis]|uniref:Ubiquitin-like domain-containing protein n=1 Tax=Cymbomonas tetramitiformis TaxID=36881 RepID=A0AAE0BDA0_9CHLO|nr:hypothetical protein CYMTET_55895 [Cymbomonas tetramitiformis]KAK3247432.1 hypothetical protein CYMTET_43075 [Cymbomonas tetramitiformis]